MTSVALHHGDCRQVLATLAANSIDSVVCDPPYELGFMGKAWDSTGIAYDASMWTEVFRVLKPGGHLLAFGGSRTYHRLACAVEDAGFEIRDQIMWIYGSGFPKSHNIAIAIDKQAGVMEHRGKRASVAGNIAQGQNVEPAKAMPQHDGITDDARRWKGWGTALKPAHEPLVVARKPIQGTVAQTVLEWGTGAMNIDGCRVPSDDGYEKAWDRPVSTNIGAGDDDNRYNYISDGTQHTIDISANKPVGGRWPANVVHDGSDEVLGLFPDSKGGAFPKKSNVPTGRHYEGGWGAVNNGSRTEMGDGSAARFFYCAKANKTDRNDGASNNHPTVKPTDLMRYLVRLVTPAGGTVLDPFMGSGSTGKAAVLEGFGFVGIEQDANYLSIADARIKKVQSRSGQ